ncbi:MAG: M20/M25/M40 family metallo-hydrolase [Actinomycetota bacterium]|nr:M20/M25/M40 family metallo-hydrolase [Actinomycetota bacterium]
MIEADRVTRTFTDLVKIKSESFKEKEVAKYIINKLAAKGVNVRTDAIQDKVGSDTGNVVFRVFGKKELPNILLMAHMDTISHKGNVTPVISAGGIITSGGETILGADNKAGIAAIIEMVEAIHFKDFEHGDIVGIFTVAEEVGSIGTKSLDFASLNVDYAFVLDGEGEVGSIITKSPTQKMVKAKFLGKSAHSGINPEDGIDAIRAAARAISFMKLGRVDEETTANIGVIRGGSSFNVIADEVILEGEIRGFSEGRIAMQIKDMTAICNDWADRVGADVELDIKTGFQGYDLSDDEPIVRMAMESIRSIGLEPRLVSSGGGSDANILSEKGIKTINLATGMKSPHSVDESIEIDDLANLSRVILEIVKRSSQIGV